MCLYIISPPTYVSFPTGRDLGVVENIILGHYANDTDRFPVDFGLHLAEPVIPHLNGLAA